MWNTTLKTLLQSSYSHSDLPSLSESKGKPLSVSPLHINAKELLEERFYHVSEKKVPKPLENQNIFPWLNGLIIFTT